jgi:hypothetical protein
VGGDDETPDINSGNTITKNNGAISFTGLYGEISHNTISENTAYNDSVLYAHLHYGQELYITFNNN